MVKHTQKGSAERVQSIFDICNGKMIFDMRLDIFDTCKEILRHHEKLDISTA